MLPDVIVVGAMKCGTSALHEHLDSHPEVAMSRPKELNFFNGPAQAPHGDPDTWWATGQWHRGLEWYSAQFDAEARARGESSPGYTSPSHPEVPHRMAAVLPDVRLVYLVRDPVERALSQYAHHRRDGQEHRPVEAAVLDPDAQYLARSRYHERIEPFLEHFDRDQLHVVVQERLLRHRDEELAKVHEHIRVDPTWRGAPRQHLVNAGEGRAPVDARLRAAVMERVGDDVERLRDLVEDELEEWR